MNNAAISQPKTPQNEPQMENSNSEKYTRYVESNMKKPQTPTPNYQEYEDVSIFQF